MNPQKHHKSVAIVGIGAVLPGARNINAFWNNLQEGRYSIVDVPKERWDADLYHDPDPKTPDKTYSRIGGWVTEFDWEPLKWRLPIPPKVSDQMDLGQKWGIVATREALADYGYPERPLNNDRTAVILGNAMGGDKHLETASRIMFPEYARELELAPAFSRLPQDQRENILSEMKAGIGGHWPEITEDTMPGELSNIIAGRIAALYNFHGPNYVTDAACASAMAAITAAIEGLEEYDYDMVVTGGIDANMSPAAYVKFSKIGALSATGTRPYAEGADGFVMGEGAVIFLLKRLEDAERDGDKIYAVIRGVGGSSDGKGKGITAPNPIGQKFSIQRGWENAGVSPKTVSMVEGHGTSTSVGDAVELQVLDEIFGQYELPPGSVALGSVKSNVGHLKGAAGAAGILKTTLALHHKMLPPSLNFVKPNPNVDFTKSPFYVNTALKPWKTREGLPRRAGVSAFGFGGTNFHAVLEEYIPGRILEEERKREEANMPIPPHAPSSPGKVPLRGAILLGGNSDDELAKKLDSLIGEVRNGKIPAPAMPHKADLESPNRIAIDYGDAEELTAKASKALKALRTQNPGMWKMLNTQGIFYGQGPAPKVAFLYPGQGSQYANMLHELREKDAVIREVFQDADAVMTPLLGKPLSDYIFVNGDDPKAMEKAEEDLKQTTITQPAVLATDVALTQLLREYGIEPDYVMGHSLGEYGALVASGAMSFANAMKAVSARGTEMTKVSVSDNGLMAAVFAPLEQIRDVLTRVEGYVEIANINSNGQAVIGGATDAVTRAVDLFRKEEFHVSLLPVSHAFHTRIVAPASEPLGRVLQTLELRPPIIPIVANVTGELYPMGPDAVPEMVEILARQVASPVQFIKGLETLFNEGVRVFVEVGPKKALKGFVDDVLGNYPDVISLFTNHPKIGEVPSFNQSLCGLWASGIGVGTGSSLQVKDTYSAPAPKIESNGKDIASRLPAQPPAPVSQPLLPALPEGHFAEMGRLFADFMEKSFSLYAGDKPEQRRREAWITGASLGLPGVQGVFNDANVGDILNGKQFIKAIPDKIQGEMVAHNITRLVKSGKGGPHFETIGEIEDVIKLAARREDLDIVRDFSFPEERMAALDVTTQLAIGAGIDALRDAGIPLTMQYKTTTKGTQLPDRWMLPEALQDETGIIFASAFPGYNAFTDELKRYFTDQGKRNQLAELESIRAAATASNPEILNLLDNRIAELTDALKSNPYEFDRRFLFKVLSMGHSQFAEYIGARGPNTAINAACSSTTQAVGMAKDWIETGRCGRVVVISADDVTSDEMLGWIGSGFLASGAAATDEKVEDAAIPFDRRRHGMIVGMGAAAIVLESPELARNRGIQPICEVLSSVAANSAFHGTRLDVNHISGIMEKLVSEAEAQWGINRYEIAREMVFVSHETYTPARGGSASAEVNALRKVFAHAADQIVMANTKGFTGHPMAVGIEDVVAIKILETGIVPPVANFREVDPELGQLNLSKGGEYPVRYALRLGAGFGSQISMSLIRHIPAPDGNRRKPDQLGFNYRISNRANWENWLKEISGMAQPELEVYKRTLRFTDPIFSQKSPDAPVVSAQQPEIPKPQVQASAKIETPAVTLTVPQPSAVPATDKIAAEVLRIVAEQTGYPPEMLQPDLDLEADLGIDTVKQAEMFAAIREVYDIPRDENIQLRDYPTLGHAIQFVLEKRPDLKAAGAQPPEVSASPQVETPVQEIEPVAVSAGNEAIRDEVLRIVAEQTGYPPDMLDPELDLEADLGIDTVKQAEMFAAIREVYDIPRDENIQLRDYPTLGHAIQFVLEKRPDLKADIPVKTEVKPLAPPVVESPVSKPAVSAGGDEAIRDQVLKIIAEQTGYPIDMLDLELDLEADLGIDTVKQAEMFAAIREVYDIPRDENIQLRDYPTLGHAIQFVLEKRPDLKAGIPAVQTPVSNGQPETHEVLPKEKTASGEPDAVVESVLKIVAEQTGYPQDMLDLELDMEADLGIDTVKQAEMFAAIREVFGIPRDENIQLRDYPTLGHAIQFVLEKRPDLAGGEVAPAAESPLEMEVEAEVFTGDSSEAFPARSPLPLVRPSIDLCKRTDVSLGKGSRVIVVQDTGGIGKALVRKLEKEGVEVLSFPEMPEEEAFLDRINAWIEKGSVHGIYWLPALDVEAPLSGMSEDEWKEAIRIRVKMLQRSMRACYELIQKSDTFLLAATRMGGLFGFDEKGAIAPLGGAVAGFVKSYKREHPEVLAKVIDLEPSRKTTALADLLIEETLYDPGIVEVGYQNDLRWTLGLEVREEKSGSGMTLNSETVFLVTGAAGSIVSAITADLAKASGGTFYLLDLADEPSANDPDLQQFAADRDKLKVDLFQRMKARGERATPALVEKEIAKLERSFEVLKAVRAIEAAGGKAFYRQVNLLDNKAVSAVVKEISRAYGRIDVLLHAGGIEISRLLRDKTPEEFDRVFEIKASGWYNLLSAMGDMPLGAAVAFSSIAGRFGNKGQADYSAANDFLCKSILNLRSARPETRGVAIDWTAWSGIGMASRGSIPEVMKQAGISMLPPEAGIPVVRNELTSGSGSEEIVLAGSLGVMLEEWDETGGLDNSPDAIMAVLSGGLMVGSVKGMFLHSGLETEVVLDPKEQPFLYDHQIDGTPVLPGVMGIEAMTEAARLLFPEWAVTAIEEVEFLAPFKFYRNEPRTVIVNVRFARTAEGMLAECSLSGSRKLFGKDETEQKIHFTARIRLSRKPLAAPKKGEKPVATTKGQPTVSTDAIYRLFFHGPAYQVLNESWKQGEKMVGSMATALPHEAKDGQKTMAAPRFVELCFQTAGLWEMGQHAQMGLPGHIDRLRIFRDPASQKGKLFAMVRPVGDGFDASIVDSDGKLYVKLEGYRTAKFPGNLDADLLKPLQAVVLI
jgi:malonyl CoA-acyl carrier protein transacylase